MAMTPEEQEYADAFNEGETEVAIQSDDDAFGLTPPAEAVAAAEDAAVASVDGNGDASPGDSDQGGTGEAKAADGGPAGDGDPLAKPAERQKEGGGAEPEAAVATLDADADSGAASASDGTPDVAIAVVTPLADDDTSTPDLKTDPAAGDDEPTDPKDIQRKKSWEGRLNAREAELKALAAELEAKAGKTGETTEQTTSDALEQVAEKTNDAGLIEAAESAAEAVESGEMTPEQAIKTLSEDFGEGFTKMLSALIQGEARKLVDGVKGELSSALDSVKTEVNDVIEHIANTTQREHFKGIAAAHPDFMEVNKDPAFEEFVAAKGPAAEATRNGGSTEEVIALLDEFKASRQSGDPAAEAAPAAAAVPETVASATEDEIDGASAVRGGGMQIPDAPKKSDDFAAAWGEFEDQPSKKAA